MKNFTNNFKQITSRLSARWLIMALMLLMGTSAMLAANTTQSDGSYKLYFKFSGGTTWWNNTGCYHYAWIWADGGSGQIQRINKVGTTSNASTGNTTDVFYMNIPNGMKLHGMILFRGKNAGPANGSTTWPGDGGYQWHNRTGKDNDNITLPNNISTYNLVTAVTENSSNVTQSSRYTTISTATATLSASGYKSGSGTQADPYVYDENGTMKLTASATIDDHNFQIQLAYGSSTTMVTSGVSKNIEVSLTTAASATAYTVKYTPCLGGSTSYKGTSSSKTIYYKTVKSCTPPILTLTTKSATINKGETINLTTLSGASASDGGVIEWSVNTSGDPITSEEQTINSTKTYWARAVGDCRSAARGFTVNVACEKTFYLVGSSEAIFGTAWSPGLDRNEMNCDLNVRTKTYTNVTLKAGTYSYKYTSGKNWNDEYPSGENNNKTFTIDADGIYNITFTATGTSTSVTDSEVTIAPACTPSATITEATYSCYGNTIHLEGSLTEACGGMYYGWQYKTTAGDDWSTATAIAGHATYNYSESATTYELDWTIPTPGTTYYFRAYATPDANTWYSDGTSKPVTTYARATQYEVTGNENTLTLSGSQTGYTYTLYDKNDDAVAESHKEGTGNALTWNLSGVSTFSVKARPTGSTCDEVAMNGNYTNKIDPISDVTLDYCNEDGKDIDDPKPMCKGATAYVKLEYAGSNYSDIKWLVEGVETNLVTDKGNGVWSYIIQGTGQLSVELRNDANKDNEDNPTWATSDKLSFTMKAEPAAPYISIDPASGIICEGSSATIKVENPSIACSYKLVEEEDTKAGFTEYESGDLKYSVGSVGKYYVAAKHIECPTNEYTSNQVAINQIIRTSAKISIEPTSAETTPWEKVSIKVIYDEGYGYDLTYPNGLDNVENVIIEQVGDTYTYSIPRPWETGNADSERESISYLIKAKLKVDGEATQCNNMSEASTTITLKDEENEVCN